MSNFNTFVASRTENFSRGFFFFFFGGGGEGGGWEGRAGWEGGCYFFVLQKPFFVSYCVMA